MRHEVGESKRSIKERRIRHGVEDLGIKTVIEVMSVGVKLEITSSEGEKSQSEGVIDCCCFVKTLLSLFEPSRDAVRLSVFAFDCCFEEVDEIAEPSLQNILTSEILVEELVEHRVGDDAKGVSFFRF